MQSSECPHPGCEVHARPADILSVGMITKTSESRSFRIAVNVRVNGGKLDRLAELLTTNIKPGERALIFTQFEDLEDEVAKALKSANILVLQLKGNARQRSTVVQKFQKETLDKNDERVLLLNVGHESAAGMNLTTANHCFFVHPLLVATQYCYTQWETQAIGRIRRYGQQRKCHIYRLIAQDTIEKRILDERLDFLRSQG